MKNLLTFATASAGAALLLAGAVVAPAQAAPLDDDTVAVEPGRTPSGLQTTSAAAIVDGGLQRVREFTGTLSWSVDGLGINDGTTGSLQVEKPAGATVLAAYLMTAGSSPHDMPTDITLDGESVEFSIEASETASEYGFTNFFADVTTIVTPIVTAGSGSIDVLVDEGEYAGQIEGTSLVVVFNDPSVSLSSVAIYFGTSDPAGDAFDLAFNALSTPQTQDLRMSMGSAYSYGSEQNTRVLVNGEVLSEYAGHFDDCTAFVAGVEVEDDWTCGDGALITVGGVGDSLTNPALGVGNNWSTVADDELYSLAPYVTVGDTVINVVTSNASADDNIFMTVFYLDEIELLGEGEAGTLAETGPAETSWLAAAGAALLMLGMLTAAITRRRTQRTA